MCFMTSSERWEETATAFGEQLAHHSCKSIHRTIFLPLFGFSLVNRVLLQMYVHMMYSHDVPSPRSLVSLLPASSTISFPCSQVLVLLSALQNLTRAVYVTLSWELTLRTQ